MEKVERYLRLDFVENTVLSPEYTLRLGVFNEPGKNFQTFCGVWEDQFFFAEVKSIYTRNDVRLKVTAMATVEHPTVDEKEYHSTNITYFDVCNREVLSEQYVTKAGIPVLIVKVMEDYRGRKSNRVMMDCFACFAVNNISYKVEPVGWAFNKDDQGKYASPEEKVMATLIEVLDGFVIE